MRWLLFMVAVGIFTSACADNDSTARPGVTAESTSSLVFATATFAPTMAPPAIPYASVEVVWFHGGTEELKWMRFLAVIHNSSSQTIEGLEARWNVLDSKGTVLMTQPETFVALPPGDSYHSWATSSNLEPRPVSVEMTLTSPGRLTSGAPTAVLGVTDIVMRPTTSGNQYNVTALVTSGDAEIDSTRLMVLTVGRDASGKVVGASFCRPDNVLPTIPANTQFKTETCLDAPDGVPVTVEVYAQVNSPPE